MLKYHLTRNAILCAVALLAIPLFASARPKSETTQVEKKTIDLDHQATVDGKALTPGKYEVLIEGSKVSFERDGQNVVTAPCDWKTLPFKAPYNSTTFSAKNVLQELQFEGSNQALDVM
jgi:hypothetical protein